MGGGTQELYVLSDDRRAEAVRAFLERFLPGRAIQRDEFWIPEFANPPREVLRTEDGILEHLEAHADEPYGLYWDHGDGLAPRQALVFYTRDGNVILGLADLPERAPELLRELARFAGSSHALMGWEQRPPDTAREFIEWCRRQG
ncbi:hypothetical protein [Myxococcus sp. AB025B]|uniref:hypothetical protein n=1 Tax=Myxococcus sp. AB025B TaxID=2562794 RepID=UPI0018913E28|nr:hypothetical protein [Myxococcus sp. AB025B]